MTMMMVMVMMMMTIEKDIGLVLIEYVQIFATASAASIEELCARSWIIITMVMVTTLHLKEAKTMMKICDDYCWAREFPK